MAVKGVVLDARNGALILWEVADLLGDGVSGKQCLWFRHTGLLHLPRLVVGLWSAY